MDIFGLVLTVRLKESLDNVRAPLRTALASRAPSINVITIIKLLNASRQLVTSSENLVASAQFLVALVTSESQF